VATVHDMVATAFTNVQQIKSASPEAIAAISQVYATAALVEETARLADAQETSNKIAALSIPGLLSASHRASLVGQIGASLYGGEGPHA
jgi:hypothetical protein